MRCLPVEEVVVVLEIEDAVAALAGEFVEDTVFHEECDQAVGGCLADREALRETAGRGDRTLVEFVHHADGVGGRSTKGVEEIGFFLSISNCYCVTPIVICKSLNFICNINMLN